MSVKSRGYGVELLVGIFIFSALTILGVYTIILSRDNLFTKRYEVKVNFKNIANLKEGDFVLFRGMPVGRVSSFHLEESKVVVTLRLDNELKLYKGYSIEIRHTSMLGGKHIEVENGEKQRGLVSADSVLEGFTPPDLITSASKMLSKLKEDLDKGQIFENASAVFANLKKTTDMINSGKGSLSKFMNDATLYDKANEALASVKSAGESIKGAADTLKTQIKVATEGDGTIAKLIKDPSIYDKLNSATSDVKQFTMRLKDKKSSIGRILTDNGKIYNSIKKTFDTASEITVKLNTAQGTLGKLINDPSLYNNITKIAAKLNEGTGTLGKLINDPSLYNDAKDVINNVKGTVKDMREQVPVSTFGSFIFSAL